MDRGFREMCFIAVAEGSMDSKDVSQNLLSILEYFFSSISCLLNIKRLNIEVLPNLSIHDLFDHLWLHEMLLIPPVLKTSPVRNCEKAIYTNVLS